MFVARRSAKVHCEKFKREKTYKTEVEVYLIPLKKMINAGDIDPTLIDINEPSNASLGVGDLARPARQRHQLYSKQPDA